MKTLDPSVVLLGSGSLGLESGLVERFGAAVVRPRLERLPDGEMHVALGCSLRGRSGFIIQSLGAPVGERLLELALIADAARRAGADELVAIVPYLGYSRHDRRSHEGEPLGAAVVARLLSSCGFSRVLTLDLHAPALEGFFACPVDNLSAEPLLASALEPFATAAVIVAPDLGAMKLARRYATRLDLPFAVVHKSRLGPSEVVAHQIVGDVRGRRPIIVDDLISTGVTISAALAATLAAGATPEAVVAATHAVFAPGSDILLAGGAIHGLIVTDSTEPMTQAPIARCQRVSLAGLWADVIERLSENRSLQDLLAAT